VKHFSLILVLSLFTLLLPQITAAENVSLSWSGREFDDSVLLQFRDMNENQIVESLRNIHGLKVLIIPSDSPNPNLTIGNLDEDQEAIEYYFRDTKFQTAIIHGMAAAEFMPPYYHIHKANVENDLKRPYIDKPLILLLSSASRSVIIHEFIHFHLYRLEERGTVLINGVRHDTNCAIWARSDIIKKNMEENNITILTLALIPDLTPEEIRRWSEFLDLYLPFLINEIEILDLLAGEEVDVYALLIEYGEVLNFSRQAIQSLSQNMDIYKMVLKLKAEFIAEDIYRTLLHENMSNIYSFGIQGSYRLLQQRMREFNLKLEAFRSREIEALRSREMLAAYHSRVVAIQRRTDEMVEEDLRLAEERAQDPYNLLHDQMTSMSDSEYMDALEELDKSQ